MDCCLCKHELRWESDVDAEDILGEEYAGKVISYYTCPNCGAEYEITYKV